MNILVLNCGSSSLKFQLIATDLERIAQNTDKRLAHGADRTNRRRGDYHFNCRR